MAYVIDRHRALRDVELVAILPVRKRGVRSRLLLRDGSLYHTLTRPVTFRRKLRSPNGQATGER